MNIQPEKCVMVIDGQLPPGLIANTSAILGAVIGAKVPGAIGQDVTDSQGGVHAGIIRFPVPVLRGNQTLLTQLRDKLAQPQFSGVISADFSQLAQGCKIYEEYIQKMGRCAPEELVFLGLAMCGSRRQIDKLTGNLPLLR